MKTKFKITIILCIIFISLYMLVCFIFVSMFENKVKQINFKQKDFINFKLNKNDTINTLKIDNKKFLYHYFNNNNVKKTVILNHGITVNKNEVSIIANKLYNEGYNIVLYDLRTHGENKNIGTISSFSTFESSDLHQIVLNIKHKYPQNKINLYGVSMGAATVIKYAQKYDNENLVNSYVAESSYQSMYNQINSESKSVIFTGIAPFSWGMDIILKFKHNYMFEDDNLTQNMKLIKHPLLLLSPSKDPRINVINSQILLKNANKKYVTLKIFEQNKHAQSFIGPNKDVFFNILVNFYKKHD